MRNHHHTCGRNRHHICGRTHRSARPGDLDLAPRRRVYAACARAGSAAIRWPACCPAWWRTGSPRSPPVTNNRRNRSLPVRLMPPRRCLPPVECSFGVRPIPAARWRPDLDADSQRRSWGGDGMIGSGLMTGSATAVRGHVSRARVATASRAPLPGNSERTEVVRHCKTTASEVTPLDVSARDGSRSLPHQCLRPS
jgi:hypothetical protein